MLVDYNIYIYIIYYLLNSTETTFDALLPLRWIHILNIYMHEFTVYYNIAKIIYIQNEKYFIYSVDDDDDVDCGEVTIWLLLARNKRREQLTHQSYAVIFILRKDFKISL